MQLSFGDAEGLGSRKRTRRKAGPWRASTMIRCCSASTSAGDECWDEMSQ